MKQSGFKPRKTSLRDAYLARLKREGIKTVWNRNGKALKRKPLKKVSRSQRERLKRYYTVRNEFLSLPENANCRICEVRRNHGENIPQNPATECHHRAGRSGDKLFDTADLVPSCFFCRLWPHEHPREARAMGLLK